MTKKITCFSALLFLFLSAAAQPDPGAGNWKTWLIPSVKAYRLPAPASYQTELQQVLDRQKKNNPGQIRYWHAGGPVYRWHELISHTWNQDTGRYGALANMLLHTAIYDAIVAAWDNKYLHKRPLPFEADKRVHRLAPETYSPGYPCEFSVAAGAAVTILTEFYPALADTARRMATAIMDARVAAGMAFPSDTRAGFELGSRVARQEILHTRDFVNREIWDGKVPPGTQRWRGYFALLPLAGKNRTAVLENSRQFRPGPPPDYASEMEELKKFKPGFRSLSNAFYWANQDYWDEQLLKKIFEHNLHLDPPQAARLFAIAAVAIYDGFVACWEAKYTYWGIRPNQYDTSYRPPIFITPPFPGYPSGHAALGGVLSEILSWFFPEDRVLFSRKAEEAAESRFQAGIHFRSDNVVALDMGKKIGRYIIQRIQQNGDGHALLIQQ